MDFNEYTESLAVRFEKGEELSNGQVLSACLGIFNRTFNKVVEGYES